MPIEAAAIDHLTERAQMPPDLAIAIAKSIDLSIAGANLVTVPILNERFAAVDARLVAVDARFASVDARFAQSDAKMEVRFASLEKSIASAKVWAVYLYATLALTFFGALAADHHWLVNREDHLIDRLEAQVDKRLEQEDRRFEQIEQHLQQIDRHLEQLGSIHSPVTRRRDHKPDSP
jgi:hypothetical protein